MQNHELITDDEWYRRLVEEVQYVVIEIRYSEGITRVVDVATGELYDVKAVRINGMLMLEVNRVCADDYDKE